MKAHPMSTLHTNLYERSLELAAGTPVSRAAYEELAEQGQMNLAKLQALGKAFRQGWLHNVLARITPLTARETTDYTNMAALFVQNKAQAEMLMHKLSADLSRFATLAGVTVGASGNSAVPVALLQHVNLYQQIGAVLQASVGAKVPAPFASTTISSRDQADMPFVRDYVRERFAA
jgi:hypothetical protein